MKYLWLMPSTVAFLLLSTLLLVGNDAQQHYLAKQLMWQQLATELTDALTQSPALNTELLSSALTICQCEQIRWQTKQGELIQMAGVLFEQSFDLNNGWHQQGKQAIWVAAMPDNQQLLLIGTHEWRISALWWSFIGMLVLLFIGALVWYRQQYRQWTHLQNQIEILLEQPSDNAGNLLQNLHWLNSIAEERHKLHLQLNELQQKHQLLQLQTNDEQNIALLQVQKLQQQELQRQHQLHCWRLLAQQSEQLNPSYMSAWLSNVSFYQQTEFNYQTEQFQSFAQWFAKHYPLFNSEMPNGCLLLADEDAQFCRFKIHMSFEALQKAVHSLLALIRPFNDGSECLLSYRFHHSDQSTLSIALQYNGKSVPARCQQILRQGPIASPDWIEFCSIIAFKAMDVLQAKLQIEELVDLGMRFVIEIPVAAQQTAYKRLCQNLLVCDSRSCRQDLLKQCLVGISEQVVVVSSLDELFVSVQSRLIDMIVIHCREEAMTDHQLTQLKKLALRYPLYLFSSQSLEHFKSEDNAMLRILPSPVLLGPLMDVHFEDLKVGQQHLLVVDDNQTNLSFIHAMLDDKPITIDYATCGRDAVRLASQNRYQLILMDIQLPDISGIDVTKQIRQLRHHQHTQILAFTAHALPEEAAAFRIAGMDDVLYKPLDARKIAHILHRIGVASEITSRG